MDSLQQLAGEQPCTGSCWEPAADVYQTPDGWLLKFDLAGVRPEDVTVRIDGNQLTVAGSRRDQISERGTTFYRMEIAYCTFQRTIELPADVSSSSINTEMRDGMLLIRLPN